MRPAVTPRVRRLRGGLRWRATLAFALGGLLVSVVLTTATYVIARGYLVKQRENTGLRQAYADASFLRDALRTAGASPAEVIGDISPRAGSRVLIEVGSRWYATELGGSRNELPADLLSAVRSGEPAMAWARVRGEPVVVVGTPLPAVGVNFFEISTVAELDRTLAVLRTVLGGVGAVTAIGAGVVGRSVARRVVRPLDDVAAAATAIAAGRMDTRLDPTEDPDLIAIVGSFNMMVDGLAARIEREARFTADVSHELRSPLTTLVTGLELLVARRDELPQRSQRALDLVQAEVDRLQRTLGDLLELARMDADATDDGGRTPTDVVDLLAHALRDGGRGDVPFTVDPAVRSAGAPVRVDRRQVERALVNLFENADRYGGGVTGVVVDRAGADVLIAVDDAGPGVPAADRERIFARFARGPAPRGSTRGTGLGLSLVAETARRHGGAVWCTDSPAGGARFVLRLPSAVPAPAAADAAAAEGAS